MIRQWLLLSALIGFGLQHACADTIQLKEQAAIVGKVLAEKPDQIAVDVGYTVLVIPRSQVVRILRNETTVVPAKPPWRRTAPLRLAQEVLRKHKQGSIQRPTNPLRRTRCSSW